MIDSTELVLESLLETQLKLKILHSSKTIYSKDMESLIEIKKKYSKTFFKSFILNSFKESTFL